MDEDHLVILDPDVADIGDVDAPQEVDQLGDSTGMLFDHLGQILFTEV